MSLRAVALGIAARTRKKAGPTTQGATDEQGAPPAPSTSETLTKYIPTEVVGIVTGAYGLVIPMVKESRDLRAPVLMVIAALGLVAMILVLAIQVVMETRKTQPEATLLSVGFSGAAAGEFAIAAVCYAAWVTSLMAGFLDQPLPAIAGVVTIFAIHMVEPFRNLLKGSK
jgi:hypothetical protein